MSSSTTTTTGTNSTGSNGTSRGGTREEGGDLVKSAPQSPPNARQLLSRLAQAEATVRLQQQQLHHQQQQHTPPREPCSPYSGLPLGSPGHHPHVLFNGKRVSSSTSSTTGAVLSSSQQSVMISSATSRISVSHRGVCSTKTSAMSQSSDPGSPRSLKIAPSPGVKGGNPNPRSPTSSLVSPSLTIDERSDKENEQDQRPEDEDQKVVQNNNTSSYAPGGGRLKFYKDGRCLLELTHQELTDQGNNTWTPVTKKVFWPPTSSSVSGNNNPNQPKTPSTLPTATVVKSENGSTISDTASTADGASIPSPWPPSTTMSHRSKGDPSKLVFSKLSEALQADLSFIMKPPALIEGIRRKDRHMKQKLRRPYQSIFLGSLLMRMETPSVLGRSKRRPFLRDRINQSSRLESIVSKIYNVPKKRPIFQIQSWDGSKLDTRPNKRNNTHVGSGPNLVSTHPTTGVTRVKSELCPVTETCTAATMPLPSQSNANSRNAGSNKVKGEPKPLGSVSHKLPNHPFMGGNAKMMPITAIPARIKSEVGAQAVISSSHIMPDMHRIKMEISGNPGLLNRSLPNMSASLSLSPGLEGRETGFISPRKRLLHHSFEATRNGGGSPAKKHRLSTDSRGSAGSSDGTSSPQIPLRNPCHSPRGSSPFHLPSLAASPPRPPVSKSSSFSIESIINQENRPVRPRAIPASPAMKKEAEMMDTDSRSTTPASSIVGDFRPRSPPRFQMSTYAARSGIESTLDPYLAHLAGVAANPSLGLTPTHSGGRGLPYSFSSVINPSLFHQQFLANNAMSPLLAASQLAAVSGMWTPPVATSASIPSTLSQGPPSMAHHHMISAPKPPTAAHSGGATWTTPQYRGAPRVATPDRPIDVSSTDDVPLDLCTKR